MCKFGDAEERAAFRSTHSNQLHYRKCNRYKNLHGGLRCAKWGWCLKPRPLHTRLKSGASVWCVGDSVASFFVKMTDEIFICRLSI